MFFNHFTFGAIVRRWSKDAQRVLFFVVMYSRHSVLKIFNKCLYTLYKGVVVSHFRVPHRYNGVAPTVPGECCSYIRCSMFQGLGVWRIWAPPIATIASLHRLPRQEKMARPHARHVSRSRRRDRRAHLAETSLSKARRVLRRENLSHGILWPVPF